MNRAGQEHIILDAPKFENFQFQADLPYYDVMPDGEHFVMLLTPQYPSPTSSLIGLKNSKAAERDPM